MGEKGKDPKKVIRLSDKEIIAFGLTLDDGTVGQAFIYAAGDGYFSLGCLNVMQSLRPLNVLAWYMAAGKHDLMASAETRNDEHYALAALRTKPQSVDELRQELGTFVTRVGMAVDAFRKVVGASQTKNPPDRTSH